MLIFSFLYAVKKNKKVLFLFFSGRNSKFSVSSSKSKIMSGRKHRNTQNDGNVFTRAGSPIKQCL